MTRLGTVSLFVLCTLLASPAAGQDADPRGGLTIFATASLSEAFRELAQGKPVRFNFAGSQQLARQLEQGARADVFASADQRWMDYVLEKKLAGGEPRVFAHNVLVVIVPKTNPGRIRKLEDLAKRGVKLVVGAEAVPVGKYTREAIENLAHQPGFPPGYSSKVLGNMVSQEENVKSVVAKVQLGEADAGFVYRSDVTREVSRYLTVLEIPKEANVLASYPIVVLAGGDTAAARSFVNLVTGAEGKRVLAKHGLIPAGSTP
jgi:molybdate transport system substrate-binding protein